MFFQGSLQEGIAAALQQQKLVVCFVTDEGEESQLWETDFLADDPLTGQLLDHAIALRLTAGSTEAGYLEALFPVPMKPTVVFIQGGQLKEYIAAGTPKDEFVRRANTAFSSIQAQSQPPAPVVSPPVPQPQSPVTVQSSAPSMPHVEDDVSATPSNQTSSDPVPAPTSSTSPSAQNARIQSMLAERAKREEKRKEKMAQEARARAEKEAQAKAQRRAEGHLTVSEKAAEEVKERKQKANEERKRILQRIEDDKRERKEREAKKKQARLLAAQGEGDAASTTSSSSQQKPMSFLSSSRPQSGGDNCNIQIRLFNGSTMRSRFPSSATLATEVRQWVDSERTDIEEKGPYTFRVVLSPSPNKAISSADENETLLSLGLAPSATLVLAPKPSVLAYASGGDGILGRIFAFFALIWASFLGIIGFGEAAAGPPSSGATSSASTSSRQGPGSAEDSRRRNAKGKGEADERADTQFYNGNSLSFEPRRDDEDVGEG